jgi:hypothetical protein
MGFEDPATIRTVHTEMERVSPWCAIVYNFPHDVDFVLPPTICRSAREEAWTPLERTYAYT